MARLVRETLLRDAAAAACAFDRQTATDDEAAWEAERLAGQA